MLTDTGRHGAADSATVPVTKASVVQLYGDESFSYDSPSLSVLLHGTLLLSSVFVMADTSVRSSENLFIFILRNNVCCIKAPNLICIQNHWCKTHVLLIIHPTHPVQAATGVHQCFFSAEIPVRSPRKLVFLLSKNILYFPYYSGIWQIEVSKTILFI